VTAGVLGLFNTWSRASKYATLSLYDASRSGGYSSVTNNKLVTFAVWVGGDIDNAASNGIVYSTGNFTAQLIRINASNYQLAVTAYSTSGTVILQAQSTNIAVGDNHIHFYADLSNTSNRGLFVGGSSKTITRSTYTNSDINWTSTNTVRFCGLPRDYSGSLYDVYLDNSYVSDNSRFLASSSVPANLGAKGIKPSGQIPLLYYNGFENWRNLGRGGDFNVSSGTVTAGASV